MNAKQRGQFLCPNLIVTTMIHTFLHGVVASFVQVACRAGGILVVSSLGVRCELIDSAFKPSPLSMISFADGRLALAFKDTIKQLKVNVTFFHNIILPLQR